MAKARRSVSDKDIVQYQQFAAKMKADSMAAGAANFNFQSEGGSGSDGDSSSSDSNSSNEEDLYGK
jgi:hypothetical protein